MKRKNKLDKKKSNFTEVFIVFFFSFKIEIHQKVKEYYLDFLEPLKVAKIVHLHKAHNEKISQVSKGLVDAAFVPVFNFL